MLQNCTFAMPLMYGIAKIGCFTAGCCRGICYDGIFCVRYTGKLTGDICVFPVQLSEAAVFIAIYIAGMALLKKHDVHSVHKVIIMSAAAKFALEFLRNSHSHSTLSIEQTVCLIVTIACLADMMRNRRRTITEKTLESSKSTFTYNSRIRRYHRIRLLCLLLSDAGRKRSQFTTLFLPLFLP